MAQTRKQFEAYLNDLYSGGMTFESAINSLVYLTTPSRGAHVTQARLESAYHNNTLGSLLRKFDPIAFNVAYNEDCQLEGIVASFIETHRRDSKG